MNISFYHKLIIITPNIMMLIIHRLTQQRDDADAAAPTSDLQRRSSITIQQRQRGPGRRLQQPPHQRRAVVSTRDHQCCATAIRLTRHSIDISTMCEQQPSDGHVILLTGYVKRCLTKMIIILMIPIRVILVPILMSIAIRVSMMREQHFDNREAAGLCSQQQCGATIERYTIHISTARDQSSGYGGSAVLRAARCHERREASRVHTVDQRDDEMLRHMLQHVQRSAHVAIHCRVEQLLPTAQHDDSITTFALFLCSLSCCDIIHFSKYIAGLIILLLMTTMRRRRGDA